MSKNTEMKLKLETLGQQDNECKAQEITIMADDGRAAYHISMSEDGVLEICTGSSSVKFGDGPVKDSGLMVAPSARNVIEVSRSNWEK